LIQLRLRRKVINLKALFRFALVGVAMIVVALISALIAMSLAIHGREVTVPDLTGQTVTEARRLTNQKDLQLVLDRQFFSANVPEGRVLSQSPAPGTRVRRSWQVRAAESLGPQRVDIPDVLGQSERAAELNLRRRGIDLGPVARAEIPGSAEERVIAQAPPVSARTVMSPKVSLLVGVPTAPQSFVMPNFTGQPWGSVNLTLQDAGFKAARVSLAETNGLPLSPASIVVSQSPPAGERIELTTTMELQVR
jgi:beta-lactam-binding protein with PASTA domain